METRRPWERKGSILAQRFTYTGQERLADLGVSLMDYDARLYYGGLGRFMQVDPMADQFVIWIRYSYALITL
ncbi:MAG: RHS repeat-associated core domain-containing protein [Saprospiraceae bacterium]